MRETEYAFAVARVRANEPALLTEDDIGLLISAENEQSALRILADRGWDEPADGKDIFDLQAAKAWDMIERSVPDPALLEAMVIGNDFFNVKAAIKAVFSDIDPEEYMASPCLCDTKTVIKAVTENDFSLLPDYLAEYADTAYHRISGGESGQSAEMILDKASLEKRLALAEKSECSLLTDIVKLGAVLSDIKIAKRCAHTGKKRETALESMCPVEGLDIEAFVRAAYEGKEIREIIADAGFTEIAPLADGDFSALEMKCDNLITEMIKKAKYDAFGPDPVVAYYYAKLAEIKNVRIILSAKAAGVPTETIKERVRSVYV